MKKFLKYFIAFVLGAVVCLGTICGVGYGTRDKATGKWFSNLIHSTPVESGKDGAYGKSDMGAGVGRTYAATSALQTVTSTDDDFNRFGDWEIEKECTVLEYETDSYSAWEYFLGDLTIYVADSKGYIEEYGTFKIAYKKVLRLYIDPLYLDMANPGMTGASYEEAIKRGWIPDGFYEYYYNYYTSLDFNKIFKNGFCHSQNMNWNEFFLSPLTRNGYCVDIFSTGIVDYYIGVDPTDSIPNLVFYYDGEISESVSHEHSHEKPRSPWIKGFESEPDPNNTYLCIDENDEITLSNKNSSNTDDNDNTGIGDNTGTGDNGNTGTSDGTGNNDNTGTSDGTGNTVTDDNGNTGIGDDDKPIIAPINAEAYSKIPLVTLCFKQYEGYCRDNDYEALNFEKWLDYVLVSVNNVRVLYIQVCLGGFESNNDITLIELLSMADNDDGWSAVCGYAMYVRSVQLYNETSLNFKDWLTSSNGQDIYDLYVTECEAKPKEALSFDKWSENCIATFKKCSTAFDNGNAGNGDNGSSGDEPGGEPGGEQGTIAFWKYVWRCIVKLFNGTATLKEKIVAIVAILIVLVIFSVIIGILCFIFPGFRAVIKVILEGIWTGLLWLLKGLWYIISAPFRLIALIGRKIAERKAAAPAKAKGKSKKKPRKTSSAGKSKKKQGVRYAQGEGPEKSTQAQDTLADIL